MVVPSLLEFQICISVVLDVLESTNQRKGVKELAPITARYTNSILPRGSYGQ